MNTLIVEDEDITALQLKQFLLSQDVVEISILGIVQTIKDLKDWLDKKEQAEIIFCDIELRDGNVLNFLKTIVLPCPIIFITAYDQYWYTALQNNGIEYLLKPITKEKVFQVLHKVNTLKKIFSIQENNILNKVFNILETSKIRSYKRRFIVRLNNEVYILDTEEVTHFKILKGVIFAFTNSNKKLPIAETTLNELEEALDPESFFRINRSEIVQLKYIKSINVNEGDEFIIRLIDSSNKLSVSNTRVTEFKKWIR
jgi:DNA-binding LytR/AlgR family response regulator